MSYSRRQLEAFGEPLGDSATRKEAGRIIYGGGGGGGGSATQTQITDIPDWVKPYAEDALSRTKTLTQDQPYQSYGTWAGKQGLSGQTVAGPTGLQTKAYEGAGLMQPSAATGLGAATAALASERALGTGYDAGQFGNQFQAPGAYNPSQFQNPFQAPGQFQAAGERAPQLQQYGMGPAQQVGTQSFAQPGAAEAYMSPYMQSVVEKQQREAQRTADIAGTQRGAQAVSQGAFGGSRQAIMDAEAARNLATQKGDIQATGTQAAYQQAQQQFNAEQQARMQAQMANQQAGLTTGQQNLAAQLGVQQLGATTGMQAQQLAEQSRQFGAGQGLTAAQLQAQYGMSAQQAQEAANQFAAQQAMTGAQTGAQYGQSAQQLEEQSRQYGAGLGLQGLQTALTGAGQLGALGQQQFTQGMDVNKLQQAYGTQQQQLDQARIASQQQEYAAQEKYPYQQLEFMSNMIRGTPMGTTQSLYAAPPSPISQMAGLGTAALGASKLMAKGGAVRGYADGGLMDLAIADMMGDRA
jgi:hypothetical protein